MNVSVINCPQCGAPASGSSKQCEFCESHFIVQSLSYLAKFDKQKINKYVSCYKDNLKQDPGNTVLATSIGLCYLDLGVYDLAQKYLLNAVENDPESSTAYFYYSLSLCKGKKPKLLTLTEVKKIEEYLNAAIMLNDSEASYYYFLLALRHEFYLKNGIKMPSPDVNEIIGILNRLPIDQDEIVKLNEKLVISEGSLPY